MKDLMLFWGDLHNHNALGYGKGSLDRTYRQARNILDFCAFIPHGWWPDLPDNDPRIKEGHERGFAAVRERWGEVVDRANAENEDGVFTAFVGFEWHSSRWGDYHVLLPGEAGDICRAETLDELMRFVREHNALAVPHHCAYRQGWRGTNWEAHDETLCPVAEIFSEHGDSFETPSPRGMLMHSMGGACTSQTVLEQLRRGKVIGVIAGTDDHWGCPAAYGDGITGLWATGLSRAEVLDALLRRHAFATTGDRTVVRFTMGQGMMGDVLPASTPRDMCVDVAAADLIDYVELNKNGKPLRRWQGDLLREGEGPVLSAAQGRQVTLRIEWGWGGMTSDDVTTWEILGNLDGGIITEVFPCFASGAASVELLNTLDVEGETQFVVSSSTSRRNTLPTASVVFRTEAKPDARLLLKVTGEHAGAPFVLEHQVPLSELHGTEAWFAVSEVFSAPRLRVGPAIETARLMLCAAATDPDPSENDFYFVKVLQKNGQMAWSSPIWCRK